MDTAHFRQLEIKNGAFFEGKKDGFWGEKEAKKPTGNLSKL